MLNHRLRCLYIHIPKTAGNSINRAFGLDWEDHKDLRRYAAELSPADFARYYKFAIVRNPWDRLLSEFNYQRKKSRPGASRLGVLTATRATRRFRDWVRLVLATPEAWPASTWGGAVSPGIHRWSPQVDWISLDGRIAVDRVLRLERLKHEFPGVCRDLGVPALPLPHRNRRRHWHYSWYYDAATRELVAQYYRSDLEAFGYEFDSQPARAWNLTQRWAASFVLWYGARR